MCRLGGSAVRLAALPYVNDAIIGATLPGLLLAKALLARGPDHRVLILDARQRLHNEPTIVGVSEAGVHGRQTQRWSSLNLADGVRAACPLAGSAAISWYHELCRQVLATGRARIVMNAPVRSVAHRGLSNILYSRARPVRCGRVHVFDGTAVPSGERCLVRRVTGMNVHAERAVFQADTVRLLPLSGRATAPASVGLIAVLPFSHHDAYVQRVDIARRQADLPTAPPAAMMADIVEALRCQQRLETGSVHSQLSYWGLHARGPHLRERIYRHAQSATLGQLVFGHDPYLLADRMGTFAETLTREDLPVLEPLRFGLGGLAARLTASLIDWPRGGLLHVLAELAGGCSNERFLRYFCGQSTTFDQVALLGLISRYGSARAA
ncbi:MAG: lycopene cyclase family protein [Geminicoccaceae bacterium]